jgi:hypothetical protein
MSRTIRRKNYVPNWVVTERVRIPGTYLEIRVPMQGTDLVKSLARHHGDAGCVTYTGSGISCPKWFRQMHQKKYRAKCYRELRKVLHDEDYEYIIRSKPALPYWD